MAPAETPDRADPITRLIASRVATLRKSRGWSQAELAERMSKLRPNWSRSTVVKFENNKRQELSVGDWMALAMVLTVPPPMLIADPRFAEKVPVTAEDSELAWNVLLWMMGRNRMAPVDVDVAPFEYYNNATEVMYSGWEIVEATFELKHLDHRWPDSDEAALDEVQRREEARHRAALIRLEKALAWLRSRGVQPPLLQPFVLKRAEELGFTHLLPESGS